MIFIRVDLPAPFSPAIAVIVPGSRLKLTPFRTGIPPNAFVTPAVVSVGTPAAWAASVIARLVAGRRRRAGPGRRPS